MTASRFTTAPRSDRSPGRTRDERARAWSFVFQCWQEKQKGSPRPATLGDDGRTKGDSADGKSILKGA